MNPLPLRLLSCALLATCSAVASASDLKIITTNHSGSSDTPVVTSTRYFQGPRSWMDFRGWVGKGEPVGKGAPSAGKLEYFAGSHSAIIQQCDAHRSMMLDLDAHEYTLTELDEAGVPKSGKSARTQPAADATSTNPPLDIFIDTVDTGERKEMFGYTARHILTKERHVASPQSSLQSSSSETDGWYIDLDVPATSCQLALKRASGTRRSGVLVAGSSGPLGSPVVIPKIEIHRTGPTDLGFPVKLTTVTHMDLGANRTNRAERTDTLKSEVTELSDAPLDPALFEVPSGFKLVEKLNQQFSEVMSKAPR